ncbi:MAG: serine/threonine-protein kinase, partial [Gemmatimonadales bacterium]
MTDITSRLSTALADRYAIEREIGAGGMATVYLAEDLKHHRQVAIKLLRPELAASLGSERFLREIEIAAKLHHPHILPLYDSGEADGFLYYVMPLVEGESLRAQLLREKQLPLEEAVQIATEVGDALSYAHSHDVLHRDIKPENVLLEAGHAVVADFGIARAITAAGEDTLTETGIAVGTPAYMSPEQAGGSRDLDGRSDIYSLGCVLYEMLAGQPPFTGPSVSSIVQQHLTVVAPPVTNIRPGIPQDVTLALSQALAKTPADRFSTAAQFIAAIAPPRISRDSLAAPAPRFRRRWIAAALGTAAAVAALALLNPFSGLFSAGGSAGDEERATRDWVLVAAFDGSADPSHLTMARALVRTVLDQSTLITTLPGDQVARGLALAGWGDTTRVTEGVARELAVRGSIGAVVAGEVDRVGRTYSVLLRVVDPGDGSILVAVNGLARGDDRLIPVIDSVARALREDLGERRDVIRANR